MKRTFVLEDLDCAHCAQKIEDAVSKLEGVEKCTVTFLTQKMVLEAADDKMDVIAKELKKIVKKIEPDVTVIQK